MDDVGRTYYGGATGSVSGPVDLWEVVSAADAVTLVEAVVVAQSLDTTSRQLPVTCLRDNTTSGSGGLTVTLNPEDPGDVAFAGVVEALNTTLATAGTPLTMWEDSFNVLQGWVWPPRPMVWTLRPSQRLVVRVPTAFGTTLFIRTSIKVREIGS